MSKDTSAKQKIRIKLKAYDHRIIDKSVEQIIETALRSGAQIVGPIPLPTEKCKITVIKSPHVHKDSREQFEMRIHRRLIDILNPSSKIVEALTNLNLPSGVSVDVKMI